MITQGKKTSRHIDFHRILRGIAFFFLIVGLAAFFYSVMCYLGGREDRAKFHLNLAGTLAIVSTGLLIYCELLYSTKVHSQDLKLRKEAKTFEYFARYCFPEFRDILILISCGNIINADRRNANFDVNQYLSEKIMKKTSETSR